MVTITLTNNNPHSQDKNVAINLSNGICIFPDGRGVSLKHFLQQTDFNHPLLSEHFTQTPDYKFQYEYDNIRELFHAPIFVYSTLLHVGKPLLCTFKINPSRQYQAHKLTDDLYFSINSNKAAVESITINQLNRIVSQMLSIKFEFSEELIIDDTFSINELPPRVNGDLLYSSNGNIQLILENPNDLSRYELRYINPMMGFGVFSKAKIKKGDIINVCSGVKKINHPRGLNFAFDQKEDCFNMTLNAKFFGNITRFINHAPDPETDKKAVHSSGKLLANLIADKYYINGILVFVYIAKRDIMPGEQLLASYGDNYFKKSIVIRFKANGRPPGGFNKFSKYKIFHLKVMADNGVKKAQTYIQLRLFIIIITICFVMASLRLVSY